MLTADVLFPALQRHFLFWPGLFERDMYRGGLDRVESLEMPVNSLDTLPGSSISNESSQCALRTGPSELAKATTDLDCDIYLHPRHHILPASRTQQERV